MIQEEMLHSIQHGVCAIGWLSVPWKQFFEDPKRPFFNIVGTGFLVDESVVMTNRHVVEGLGSAQFRFGFPNDQRLVYFLVSRPGGLSLGYCTVVGVGTVADPKVDIGLVEFKRRPESWFDKCRPLSFVESRSDIRVGQPLGILGYPYGTDLLLDNFGPGWVSRFGPVLQQGYVSAVSPYKRERDFPPVDFFMDVRTAAGMSGSPVFEPESGNVLGVHYAGTGQIIANAVPVDTPLVAGWLKGYRDLKASLISQGKSEGRTGD